MALQADGVKALMDYESSLNEDLFAKLSNADIHAWPYLRRPFGQAIARIEFPREPPMKPASRRKALGSLARSLAPSANDATRAPRSTDVLFVVAGRTKSTVDGESMNWLTDYFAADLSSPATVIQYRELPNDGTPLAFADTYSLHRAELLVDLKTTLRPLSDSHRQSTIDLAMSIANDIDYPIDEASAMNAAEKAIRNQARVVGMRDKFRRVLDRMNPRHLVMDGASYGGSRAIQVREAKERGIHVSELQHGWIGPSHGAYNCGAAMWDQRLFQYFPDTLLTFGDYWSRSVVTPSTTIPVGKPHIERLAESSTAASDRPKTVLVVSGVYKRDELIAYTKAVRDALPDDWTVLLRPHPLELSQVDEFTAAVAGESGIEIDLSADVFEALGNSRMVFGYASTVLYEALQFDCVPVIFDSPLASHYVDHPAFKRLVRSVDEIHRVVAEILATQQQSDAADWDSQKADVWAPAGVERFRAFITQ